MYKDVKSSTLLDDVYAFTFLFHEPVDDKERISKKGLPLYTCKLFGTINKNVCGLFFFFLIHSFLEYNKRYKF